VPDVRPATTADADLVATIAAEGFFDDPVLSWVLQDDATRLDLLHLLFGFLTQDMLGAGGRVDLAAEASAALWHVPGHDHHREADPSDGTLADLGRYTPDEIDRLSILDATMQATHPHAPHWYLSLVSTRPTHQSRGLGAAVLQPVLAVADAEGMPCYLESTNPRNRTLYRRQGFVDLDEIHLDGGPSMLQMWREPRA
jgi:ribosomal protein S18 acetylase RimI-like enzyme